VLGSARWLVEYPACAKPQTVSCYFKMNIKTNKTIGIGATEEKLKLAAIFFDQVIPIQKENNIPKSLICQVPIDYDIVDKTLKNDKKYTESDTQLLTENILPSYFNNRTEIFRDEVKEILYKVFNEGKNKAHNVAILEITRQVNTSSLLGIPIFNESILLNKLIEDYKYNHSHKKIEIELFNAPIIDVSTLDWLKIESAKKDPPLRSIPILRQSKITGICNPLMQIRTQLQRPQQQFPQSPLRRISILRQSTI
jgi:hypothetical protein